MDDDFKLMLLCISVVIAIIGIICCIGSYCECEDRNYSDMEDWVKKYPELHSIINKAMEDGSVSNWEFRSIGFAHEDAKTGSNIDSLRKACIEACDKMCPKKEKDE